MARGSVPTARLRGGCDSDRRAREELQERAHARQLETQEGGEDAQWSLSCSARVFSHLVARIRPTAFVPRQSAPPALIDCFGRRQKLKWKTLHRRGMRESRSSEVQMPQINKTERKAREGCCCLRPVALLWVFLKTDPTQRNKTSPFCDKGIRSDV